jgi:hypothetical protein
LINSVTSTEETKFRHKKSHSKKAKTFLRSAQSPVSISPTAGTEGGQSFNQYSKLAKNSNILDMVPDKEASIVDLKLGPGPVHFQGWVKYFKYDSDESHSPRPTTFFKNMEFYQQTRKFPNADLNEKKVNEYKYIKNEMFFYLLLTNESINILTSRVEKFQQIYDTLNVDLITPQVEDKNFRGGITDFGSFSEGFCFKAESSSKILTELPKKNIPLKTWIFCTETAKEKVNFMFTLRKIKILHQRDQGIIINNSIPLNNDKIGDLLTGSSPTMKNEDGNLNASFNATTGSITDGYWITLQEWTQCSLKCGGGLSTLHRMCVPPKGSGKPCTGPAVLTKPCNTQPCPQIKELITSKKNSTMAAKPIVKIMPFSDRPQRYTKCIIKESDMMYTKILREKIQKVENVQMPIRLVMNNKTISLFGSSDYNSLIMSFELELTEISPSKAHTNCFILSQGEITDLNILQAEICPFGMDMSSKIYNQWIYDFNLFKHQCHSNKETIELDSSDAKALDDKYNKKLASAKLDIVEDRERLVKEKLSQKDEKKYNVQIMKTNEMAMQAVQKEVSLETMVRKEEEEREQLAEKELLAKLDEEKEKQHCLVKSIQEKEKEDQFNLKAEEAAAEMRKIRDRAEKQVVIKRSQLKSDVMKMRKRAERKKAQIQAQLQAVRIQMSKDMGKIYKEGDINKCKDSLKSKENRDSYCGVNFPDDFVRFSNCKSEEEDFCSLCCETEFGDMHMDKRQQCYDTLCVAPKMEKDDGKWIWVADTNAPLS